MQQNETSCSTELPRMYICVTAGLCDCSCYEAFGEFGRENDRYQRRAALAKMDHLWSRVNGRFERRSLRPVPRLPAIRRWRACSNSDVPIIQSAILHSAKRGENAD